MGNKAYALATGIFVAILAAALIAGATWLSGYHVERTPYVLVSHSSVSGLSLQSTVYYRGVPVGTVDSIRFDPRHFGTILVRVQIDPEVPITPGSYGTLTPQGVTGLTVVELDDDGKASRLLATSAQAPAHIPLRPSLLGILVDSGHGLIDRLSQLTKDLDQLTNADNRGHVTRILANVETATGKLATLETRLSATLSTLPAVSREARRTLADIDTAAQQLQGLSRSLDQFARSATQLSQTGNTAGIKLRDTTLPQLNHLLMQMSVATDRLQRLTDNLQQDPQSLLYGRQTPPPGPGEPGYRK
ncbi:MAG: MCE family protein [Rhodanobacter sp.]|nr:MAG: MCE family protein [Rhodanobacter sp.]TAL99500.1 MAG: MCE family protein [Rhodanobacter sp.]TAM40963.1 MAG: MCE family protein [Rhodanobacter sp.]